jgi:hypothetical protein
MTSLKKERIEDAKPKHLEIKRHHHHHERVVVRKKPSSRMVAKKLPTEKRIGSMRNILSARGGEDKSTKNSTVY